MTAENKKFIAGIELKPMPNSQMFGKAAGAFVNCFIPAKNASTAKSMLLNHLAGDYYHILELEFTRVFRIDDWNKEDAKKYQLLANQSMELNKVIYDDFYTYDE